MTLVNGVLGSSGPGSSSSGGSGELLAHINISSTDDGHGPNNVGAQVFFPALTAVTEYSLTSVTTYASFSSHVLSVNAGNHVCQFLEFFPPTFSSGTLTLSIWCDVSNTACTQTLGVHRTGINLSSGTQFNQTNWAAGGTDYQTGTDLSTSGGTINTTAGGLFTFHYFFRFVTVNLQP